jgi:hypothetical protein
MKNMMKILGAAALLAGSMTCTVARADTAPDDASAAAKTPTDQELRNYAGAMAALLQLNNAVAKRSADANPTERAAIEQQANATRQSILDRYSLDPASFNAISKAVEADPALGDRVRRVMMDSVLGS